MNNEKNKILVIGSSGQVASSLKDIANDSFIFLGRSQLDITDFSALSLAIREVKPVVIINCSAYTAVDLAEKEQELAYLVNSYAVEHLAKECKIHDIPLIHISTDYVFDGTKEGAYMEEDVPNPISVYGKSKLGGELAIRHYLSKYIILRTSWVFSKYGNNFVKTMLNLAKTKKEINVVCDQVGCPTAAQDIAAVIFEISLKIIASPKDIRYGIYNFCGAPETNWHSFACSIFKIAFNECNLDSMVPQVNKILTLQYNTLAARPKNSVLDCKLIAESFDIFQAEWLEKISQVVEAMENKAIL